MYSGKLQLACTDLNTQKPSTVPPWVAVRPLARGKRKKPRWVDLRDETTLVGVGTGQAQRLRLSKGLGAQHLSGNLCRVCGPEQLWEGAECCKLPPKALAVGTREGRG